MRLDKPLMLVVANFVIQKLLLHDEFIVQSSFFCLLLFLSVEVSVHLKPVALDGRSVQYVVLGLFLLLH